MDCPRAAEARTPLAVYVAVVAETARISAPTVVQALRGTLRPRDCDRRLEDWSGRLLELARVDLRVQGGARLASAQGPFVVMSNHQSYFDIPVLYRALPGSMRMVVKKELMHVPLWGTAMRAAGFIPIDRARGKVAYAELERAGQELLRSGTNLWIAPEGTRSPNGELLPFKAGGFRLAARMGLPVLPVTIDGTQCVQPKGRWAIRRDCVVQVTIHDPLRVEAARTLTDDALAVLMATTRRRITSALPSVPV